MFDEKTEEKEEKKNPFAPASNVNDEQPDKDEDEFGREEDSAPMTRE